MFKGPKIPPALDREAQRAASAFLKKIGNMKWKDLEPLVSADMGIEITVIVNISYNATGYIQRAKVNFYEHEFHDVHQIYYIELSGDAEELIKNAIKKTWLDDYLYRNFHDQRPMLGVSDEQVERLTELNVDYDSPVPDMSEETSMQEYILSRLALTEYNKRKNESHHDSLMRKKASGE